MNDILWPTRVNGIFMTVSLSLYIHFLSLTILWRGCSTAFNSHSFLIHKSHQHNTTTINHILNQTTLTHTYPFVSSYFLLHLFLCLFVCFLLFVFLFSWGWISSVCQMFVKHTLLGIRIQILWFFLLLIHSSFLTWFFLFMSNDLLVFVVAISLVLVIVTIANLEYLVTWRSSTFGMGK